MPSLDTGVISKGNIILIQNIRTGKMWGAKKMLKKFVDFNIFLNRYNDF